MVRVEEGGLGNSYPEFEDVTPGIPFNEIIMVFHIMHSLEFHKFPSSLFQSLFHLRIIGK